MTPPTADSYAVVDLIRAKRDGHALSAEQIDWLISAYTAGLVHDEQMAAMAMAIYFRGLDDVELTRWTEAMIASGERMDFSALDRPTVDKHSTGGVGDKITLPLVPIVAACGAAVPQLSGRGLGHTGGTLDKLESIPGWQASIGTPRMLEILADVGGVICAAGAGLAPADRKLYALRDVTSTVDIIPLIASSIMSKKIAEGTSALVLDVKTGSGAFMPETARAVELARTMVRLGSEGGVRTRALVTAMDVPLGVAVGNALEVAESVDVLQGGGPADVVELTLILARHMLELVGIDADPAEAIASGRALDHWRRMIRAQGGDPAAPLPRARFVHDLVAERAGVVTRCDALAVGRAAWRLGAGRATKDDPVSATAGIEVLAKPGAEVAAGQTLLRLHGDDDARFTAALDILSGPDAAVVVSDPGTPVTRLPLIIDVIE